MTRICLCGSPTGAGHFSACSICSYSNHKAAMPVACPRSAPTWDQHLDCKHSCRGKAGDKDKAGKEWGRVGTGSPVASEESWSRVGQGTKPHHPSHSPPCLS